jgi:hypothetical protein
LALLRAEEIADFTDGAPEGVDGPDGAGPDFLVELRGLCAGRPARSNRCKSDAMKE